MLSNEILSTLYLPLAILRYMMALCSGFCFARMACLGIVVSNGIIYCLLTLMDAITGRWAVPFRTLLKAHDMIQIMLSTARCYMDIVLGGILSVLELCGILLWYGTFALHSVVPMPLYLTGSFPGVVLVAVVQIMLTPFAYIREVSKYWVEHVVPHDLLKLSVLTHPVYRKAVEKKLKTLRPFTFYAGVFDYRFFGVQSSTKVTLKSMIDFTITALMA